MREPNGILRRPRLSGIGRGEAVFATVVVVGYGLAAIFSVLSGPNIPDVMMAVAERVLSGNLDTPLLAGTADTVGVGGRYYLAVGPLQILPYLPFAEIPALHGVGGHIVGLLFGIPAALLGLPLARRYGAEGASAYWVAAFMAFGSLLFYVSIFGDLYYLAHAESFLALTLFLIEWAGRRRPAVLGVCLMFSLLARPTTILAALPFGLALIWRRREAVAEGLRFGLPIALGIAVYGWYNWVRFGSPLEAGYALSVLEQPSLIARRALGVFSIRQIPENLRLALLAGPQHRSQFPFVAPNPYGLSMLLVSPALLTSLNAGFRAAQARLMWIATAVVAVPVFLYYGGGFVQYGFRYSLDFTPFLVALMAVGSTRWTGWVQRSLVLVSIASVTVGIIWHAHPW
jgi:hypothetical protein